MINERKKLVGYRKSISKKGTSYCTLYFSETRPDVQGQATSNTNLFVEKTVDLINEKWVGKEVDLIYSVNYAKNSVFLIDVKLVV